MKTYAISEVAALLGVSVHTLRYYERAGLLNPVARVSGRRTYDDTDLAWVRFILRLRATGMPMRKIDQYARLRRQGEASVDARLALLQAHLGELETRQSALEAHRAALATKIEFYREMQRSGAAAATTVVTGERK